MKLTIIVPVHNNWNFTRSCLADLVLLPADETEIIVVDNASTDGTEKGISNFFAKNLHYVRLPENTGFAHACNYGYAISSGEHVMFLNNDIRVKSNHKDWVAPLLEKAADNIVGPTGGLLDSNLNFIKETDKMVDSSFFYMSGWNVTASRKIWDKLVLPGYEGPFTEEFGLAYFEDTDMSFRAREMNIPFLIVDVPVVHFGKITSSKLDTLKLYNPAKQKFIKKWSGRIK